MQCESAQKFPIWRGLLLFLILSLAGMAFVFRGALWGARLVAPLDIPANLYSKFKWMDPAATGVPRNHYLVDLFDFELPRQYGFYQGLKSGEFPWWEPYSDSGGHPLIAEAHNNLTDPFRLALYCLFPFELAYNWIRIIHSLLLGLGMLLLLWELRFSLLAALFGALCYQFAASHAMSFFPPNVEGSFLYYPFLWIIWSRFVQKPSVAAMVLGALVCCGIYLSGNQQSHAYLPLFAACFCLGYGGSSWQTWKKALQITAASGILGALLASPILAPQIEIYFRSKRDLMGNYHFASLLAGIFSLTGVFPWVLGTFRSLDLSKVTGESGLGFAVYVGTAGALLAIIGIGWKFRDAWSTRPDFRMSILLIAGYLVLIASTPLLKFLYTRASYLAVIGLIICCARAIDLFRASPGDPKVWRFLITSNVVLCGLVIVLNLFAFLIYPKLIPRVTEIILKRQTGTTMLDQAPRLRTFQVENLPNEISVKNPETVLALLSALSLLAFLKAPGNRLVQVMVFLLNLSPLLLFDARFIPRAPIADWHRLLQGGPEQNTLRDLTVPQFKRMQEHAPARFEYLMPGVTAIYYHVHTMNGYSAFFLKTPADVQGLLANYSYDSPDRALERGILNSTFANENVRFIWKETNPRRVLIEKETWNSISLRIEPGPSGDLIRTDSFYPGWRVRTDGSWRLLEKSQTFHVGSDVTRVDLEYRPSHLSSTLFASGSTLAILVLMQLGARLRKTRVVG